MSTNATKTERPICRRCGARLEFNKIVEKWVTRELKWICCMRPLIAHEPMEDVAATATARNERGAAA
jgi:hypothetical protein